ncbi:RNA polymerase sigma factor [Ruminococcus sp.]|uniref:RNA polymerase sigma factor n=1 Tax=Ruminococcus sp. TaxID=41978 RepID=UPI0025CC81BF|nr:RNA polymerase sigma factor [Ruminococcus sp.]MBQ9542060.1 RNA polymerase sigma factor [Ruminococcus sp.]
MKKNEQMKLIKNAIDGDRKAFEQLYRQYRDKLYFFVLKNVGSREAAEDVVSETFIDAMQNIGGLKAEEAFGSWLYSIAYRKCIRYNEENSRTAHFESEEEQESVMSDQGLNEPIKLPDDYAVDRHRQAQIKDIIDSLSPEMRSAIILYYYDERSVGEVAKILDISENAVKKRLFDARRKIRTKIEKLMDSGTFCAAPLGAVLQSSIDSGYAAEAVKASAAVRSISAIRIAAVSVAAAAAVGVPVSLYGMNIGWGGDTRAEESYALFTESSNGEAELPADSQDEPVRIFSDEFLESFKSSMTFKDFDETWYTIEGDDLAAVKQKLSQIEGVPCDDPEPTGWYMFDISMSDEISMIHSLIMTGNYVCLDGTMYKNDMPDNGRELAKYFRANGKVTATSKELDGKMAEFELVQYDSSTRICYAVSEVYGLVSFLVPENNADIFERYGDKRSGIIMNVTWSGGIVEIYPGKLGDVTFISVTGEREDFVSKHLNEVLDSYLAENIKIDINIIIDKIPELDTREKNALFWLAENKYQNIQDGVISMRDFCIEQLTDLDYRSYTNDGLPEYTLTADDGTFYQINLTDRWVWREYAYEADLSVELAKFLDKNKEEIGFQPVSRN